MGRRRIRRRCRICSKTQPNNYDLQLDVGLRAAQMNEAANICRTNFKYMYWSSVQQLVHHASSGCAMNVGDLLGSGTISGPEKNQRGSLLEISWNGTEPVELRERHQADVSRRRRFAWSCTAGARATAIASALARSKARFCRRHDQRHVSAFLRRNIPDACRMRGDIVETDMTGARACPMADASRRRRRAAIPLPAGSAAEQNRRRSSGRHCGACSRRSPRRTCTHSCRCALPSNAAEDPCRNIRSSAGVAAPWSSLAAEATADHRKSNG